MGHGVWGMEFAQVEQLPSWGLGFYLLSPFPITPSPDTNWKNDGDKWISEQLTSKAFRNPKLVLSLSKYPKSKIQNGISFPAVDQLGLCVGIESTD
jgi:hypothetical protein